MINTFIKFFNLIKGIYERYIVKIILNEKDPMFYSNSIARKNRRYLDLNIR